MAEPIQRLNDALEGRYRIERELGEGGMARVYLACDLRHDRNVALKVLKPELAAVVGAERFLAEIKTTANLQHPNILPLFDSGEADGSIFFVMPHVEDETLRERLDREKQLPVEEAVRIASEIADALDHAHARGVVHRDVKPGNVLLRDGRPLVADFGIALAARRSGGDDRLTETGMSLGTPYYMSPEQATGSHAVGPAADVYALGCVLYEMLAGEPPYVGSTPQAVLAKIITGGGRSVSVERPTVPPHVNAAVAKAIEKLPADRFESAGDFAEALGDETFRHGAAGPDAEIVHKLRGWAAVATATSAVLAIALGWLAFRPDAPRPVSRFEVTLPDSVQLFPWGGVSVDLSSDGSAIVFVGRVGEGEARAWQRRRAELDAVPIPGTRGARQVRFSPDDTRIAFTAGSSVRTVPRTGGPPQTLVSDEGLDPRGGLAWSSDGMIYYRMDDRGIWRIDDVGGEPEQVTTPDEVDEGHYLPEPLPGGDRLLYTAGSRDGQDIVAVDLETGAPRVLFPGAAAKYTSSGDLVYQSGDGTALMAVAFDPDRLGVTGSPRTVLAGVWNSIPGRYAMSDRGDLIYLPQNSGSPGAGGDARRLVWVDRSGEEHPVDSSSTPRHFWTLALAPDGDRLAVTISTGDEHLWVKELSDGPLTRLTTLDNATRPVWSPDGGSIAFISPAGDDSTTHARTIRSDGSSAGRSEVLLRRQQPVYEVRFGPGEGQLLFREGNAGVGDADIGLVTLDGDTTVTRLLATPFNERSIALSPDGRWLAYVSDISGRDEVYVRPFPDVDDGRWQVSTNGGVEPRWAHGGTEIFYRELPPEFVAGPARARSGPMMSATYAADSTFRVRGRRRLFDADRYVFGIPAAEAASHWPAYDVALDDKRFLMIKMAPAPTEADDLRLVYVQNFVEELEGARRNR